MTYGTYSMNFKALVLKKTMCLVQGFLKNGVKQMRKIHLQSHSEDLLVSINRIIISSLCIEKKEQIVIPVVLQQLLIEIILYNVVQLIHDVLPRLSWHLIPVQITRKHLQ